MLNKIVIGMSAVLAALCTAALAGVPGQPGWQYGGANCGCFTNGAATPLSCRECCNEAWRQQTITPSMHTSCLNYCDQAIFPCAPSCPWWNPFCWFTL